MYDVKTLDEPEDIKEHDGGGREASVPGDGTEFVAYYREGDAVRPTSSTRADAAQPDRPKEESRGQTRSGRRKVVSGKHGTIEKEVVYIITQHVKIRK